MDPQLDGGAGPVLLEDERHGEGNREVIGRWVGEWGREAREAAEALGPVFDALPAGIALADGLRNVQIDADELYAAAGLAEAAERT